MKKISIIVPVYNVEENIDSCIKSIINQTYKNLEVLLIDDGSTDSSGMVCDEYAKKDNRIKVIHKTNEGVSATRNLGIKISTGDFIAFIDSDDLLENNYCETLYNVISMTKSDVAVCAYKVLKDKNRIIYDMTNETNLKQNEIVVYENKDIIKEILKQKTIKNFIWNKLYKKSFLCEFEQGVHYEDIMFSINVLEKTNRVAYINKSCYNYCKRSNSITATISEQNLNNFGKAIDERYNKIKEKYPELADYNVYALLEATNALSGKHAFLDRKYKSVDNYCLKFINIILEYIKVNGFNFVNLLNSNQKEYMYLITNDINLYFKKLKEKEQQKLEKQPN